MANFDPNAFLGILVDGRYLIEECIGEGGFCLVFKALDQTTRVEVAVKILPPGANPESALEFETEGVLLNQLKAASRVVDLLHQPAHDPLLPVVIQQTSVSVNLPYKYLVLELMDGTLADVVVQRQTVDWAEKVHAFRDVVQGVHQMHLQLIVNRDVKSENVLMRPIGRRQFVAKVSDLGRSRDLTSPQRFASQDYTVGRGDLRFAPPEYLWCLGSTDDVGQRRADVYLLGSVLFELATGEALTNMVVVDPRRIIERVQQLEETQRPKEFAAMLSTIATRYESMFKLFDAEVDPRIRPYAGRLIRQLCNPDPTLRENRTRAERNLRAWGLDWLFRRIDILDRALRVDAAHRISRAS
jgi:serine/threonine protein kinase